MKKLRAHSASDWSRNQLLKICYIGLDRGGISVLTNGIGTKVVRVILRSPEGLCLLEDGS